MPQNDVETRSDEDDETADAGGEVLLYVVCETTCAAGDVPVHACCLPAVRLVEQRWRSCLPVPVVWEREHVALLYQVPGEFLEAMALLPIVESLVQLGRLREMERYLH